jgi:hypothetical protein
MDDLFGRRRFLRAVGTGSVAGGVACVSGCLGGRRPQRVSLTEGFEDGLGDWDTRGHVGPDAGGSFDWSIEITEERAAAGQHSLAIFTEGDHDDGTAWVVRLVEVVEGTAYDVRGSVRVWANAESFNTLRHLVVAVGPAEPTEEGDFPQPNTNSTGTPDLPAGGLREPLDRESGWGTYEFEWTTGELSTDELYLAAGVSVVWETDRTDYLDEVSLELVPREQDD